LVFVVGRTTDEFIELIEFKTPLDGAPLFYFDRSHDSFYPSADLSKVVGHVEKYIDKLDANRDSIWATMARTHAKFGQRMSSGEKTMPTKSEIFEAPTEI